MGQPKGFSYISRRFWNERIRGRTFFPAGGSINTELDTYCGLQSEYMYGLEGGKACLDGRIMWGRGDRYFGALELTIIVC